MSEYQSEARTFDFDVELLTAGNRGAYWGLHNAVRVRTTIMDLNQYDVVSNQSLGTMSSVSGIM